MTSQSIMSCAVEVLLVCTCPVEEAWSQRVCPFFISHDTRVSTCSHVRTSISPIYLCLKQYLCNFPFIIAVTYSSYWKKVSETAFNMAVSSKNVRCLEVHQLSFDCPHMRLLFCNYAMRSIFHVLSTITRT